MTDRRFHAANGRVAVSALRGQIEADTFVDGVRCGLTANAWLFDAPDGARDRQLLWGDPFRVLERLGGWAFGISEKDGYCGYMTEDALGTYRAATHRVIVRSTWAWRTPNFKMAPLFDLHMNSGVEITSFDGDWVEINTDDGPAFVPTRHIIHKDMFPVDRIAAAQMFIGTPYVWAGNTGFGIDCSGLIQATFHATGQGCPPDSDVQENMPGQKLDDDEPLAPGDLLFWKRHVAMAVEPNVIIHANAHHMATAFEDLDKAIARIADSDTGPITSRLRPA